jgi:hypothetical protein
MGDRPEPTVPPYAARGIRRRLCRDANAEDSQLTVMTSAEVVCVDGVDGMEAVVIRDARTGRLCAVNATAFLSCDRSARADDKPWRCRIPWTADI